VNGCRKILYYEDSAGHNSSEDDHSFNVPFRGFRPIQSSFRDHASIYASAISRLSSKEDLGSVTRPDNPSEFYNALQGFEESGFDLIVYSSQYTRREQPYDSLLASILCTDRTRAIISDNRHTSGARDILRCVGARRGNRTDFPTIVTASNNSLLDRPARLRPAYNVIDFSYELISTNQTVPQATTPSGAIAVLAQGEPERDEDFFVTVLTRSTTKVKPFKYRKYTYTHQDLHPSFRIPEVYWPNCGFDKIFATVKVTRPLRSLAKLLASVKSTNGSVHQGDTLTPREVAAQYLEKHDMVIPTETRQFTLYDDGTHGDTAPNDRYWEVSLPPDFTAVDGDYHLNAVFRLCNLNRCEVESCIVREAHQSITIRRQMRPNSKVTVEKLPSSGDGFRSSIVITPADHEGNPLGPGLVRELVLTPIGDVEIDSKSDLDGRGAYQILVSWKKGTRQRPALMIAQFGRPQNAIRVTLT
jgi:hypothetical protein